MKPITEYFLDSTNNQPLCESFLKRTSMVLAWRCSLLWQWARGVAKMNWKVNPRYVAPHTPRGQAVSLQTLRALISDKRHAVGMVLLMVGVAQIFANQILSDPYSEPHDVCRFLQFTADQCMKETGWCYISWFYYLETVRIPIALILWSVAGILFVPIKYSLAFIPFSLFNGAGWTWLFHYSMFTDSYETYHMFPYWQIAVIGFCLGFGLVMSADHLLYWMNHKSRGNHARFVGLAEMDLPAEQKEPMYKSLAKEFRRTQKTI